MVNKNIFHSSPKYLNEVKDLVKSVDYVLEIVDSRAPQKTHNSYLSEIVNIRKKILILNKADLAFPNTTMKWLDYFAGNDQTAIAFDMKKPSSIIYEIINNISEKTKKPRFNRPNRIMTVGIPNVGKSTIINVLLRRKSAKTGDRAGITRGRQWIRLGKNLELLDTAGILPPFINEENRFILAALGVLPVSQWDPFDTSVRLITLLSENELFFHGLQKRYQLNSDIEKKNAEDILLSIGAQRRFLVAGKEVDLKRTSEIFLKEFKNGLLGRFSLENPS